MIAVQFQVRCRGRTVPDSATARHRRAEPSVGLDQPPAVGNSEQGKWSPNSLLDRENTGRKSSPQSFDPR